LLRNGQRPGNGAKAWSALWWQWVRKLERVQRFDGSIGRAVANAPEHLRAIVSALQALRGVAQETAVTLALEFGSFTRFERAPQAMGYTGLVASE
jgi:hypothetical protein